MIAVDDRLETGDRVYAWMSPFPNKGGKKPDEHEYVLGETSVGKRLVLTSPVGYSISFNRELLETWHGAVHKA